MSCDMVEVAVVPMKDYLHFLALERLRHLGVTTVPTPFPTLSTGPPQPKVHQRRGRRLPDELFGATSVGGGRDFATSVGLGWEVPPLIFFDQSKWWAGLWVGGVARGSRPTTEGAGRASNQPQPLKEEVPQLHLEALGLMELGRSVV